MADLPRLIALAAGLYLRNSWPLLAPPLLLVAVQFGLERALSTLEPKSQGIDPVVLAYLLGLVPLVALVNTIYIAVQYTLVRSALWRKSPSYFEFQDRLSKSFLPLFSYCLILAVLSMTGLDLLALPLLIAIPFLDVVIFLEGRGLIDGFRRNLALLSQNPWPAVTVAILMLAATGWLRLFLHAVEVPPAYASVIAYSAFMFTPALDAAILALYSAVGEGLSPPGFPDLRGDEE